MDSSFDGFSIQISKVEEKQILHFLGIIIAYRILLDWCYVEILTRYYHYFGFDYVNDKARFVVSWFFLLLFAIYSYPLFINDRGLLSREVIFFVFIISVVPFTTMVAYDDFPTSFVTANTIYIFVLVSTVYILDRIKRTHYRIKISNVQLAGNKQLKIITVIVFLLIFFLSWRYAGLRININMLDTDSIRYVSDEFPTLLNYAYSAAKAIVPILLAYFIRRKDYFMIFLCIITQLLNFGLNGLKFSFFITFLIVLVGVLPTISYKKFNKISLYGLVGFSLLAFLEKAIRRTHYLASFISMRIFFIPNEISSSYFDFFSSHSPDYFKGSFLRLFGFKTSYPDLTFMIGRLYSSNAESAANANNGLIADAITNMGIAGVVIMPILLVIVLKLVDKCCEGIDEKIVISESISLTLIVISTFLTRMFLTDGLIFIMLLLLMMKRDEKVDVKQ